MSASQSGTFNVQEFTDLGVPLVGGRLYTYAYGTTTQKTAYIDHAGATPHTYTTDGLGGQYISLNSRGELPAPLYLVGGSYDLALKTAAGATVWTRRADPVWDIVNDFSTSSGASLVGYLPAGAGAVATTVEKELNRQTVSIFRYLTDAQISAIQAYTFTADLTSIINSALADIRSRKCDVYFPAGGYLGNFIVPGTVDGLGTDDRNTAFRIYGQGTGEPFVQLNTGGTVFKGVASIEQPVLIDILGTASSSNGTVEIDHIRFDGNTSTVPVVRLQSFYGLSSFHHNVVYQRGVGDGAVLGWGATVSVYSNYVMNKDWSTFGLGAARVGTGISYIPTADNGLVTISKCTSRGWNTAYQIAGDAAAYSACVEKSEGSAVYNGVLLQSNADKCVVSGCYFEGGEGGVGINNLGSYNTIKDNLIFPGFATGIQDIGTSNRGALIQGNLVSIGSTVSGKGIAVVSSAAFGGYNKNVLNNFVTYTAGTAGVSGISVSGTDPRLNINGNMFDPRSAWTGAGTVKINDASTNGVYGLIQRELGDIEIPVLSHGAVAFQEGVSALTQANVSANTLTIPSVGSYFSCNATSACAVQQLSAGVTPGRVVVLRTDSANMTFQDTTYIQLAGGTSFSGPGMLTLLVDRIGASNYAYEISRTVF